LQAISHSIVSQKAAVGISTSDRKMQSSEHPSRIIFFAKIAQKSLAKR
jgi:hypothetical protein